MDVTHGGPRLTDNTGYSAARPSVVAVGHPAQSTENGRDGPFQAMPSPSVVRIVLSDGAVVDRALAEAIWSAELGLAATYWDVSIRLGSSLLGRAGLTLGHPAAPGDQKISATRTGATISRSPTAP